MNGKFLTVASIALLMILVACGGTKSESVDVNVSPNSVLSSSRESVDSTETSGMHMIDPRDGQIYKTVTIGSQIWMAENLNYEDANSTCYEDFVSNCYENGRLYTWEAALESCPDGWHLPTQSDWNELFSTLGGKVSAAIALKSRRNWKKSLFDRDEKDATNVSGFSALQSGCENRDGEFSCDGKTFFWASDYYNDSIAYFMGLRSDSDEAYLLGEHKGNKYSVRCLKDDSLAKNEFVGKKALPIGQTNQQFVDVRDGKVYKTVTYGKQTWMAEDLLYEVVNDEGCFRLYCQGNGLYTWKTAVGDAYAQENQKGPVRGICPIGWHLPDTTEWNTLIAFLGGKNLAGNVLVSTADNGFSAIADLGMGMCKEDQPGFCGSATGFWSTVKDNEDDKYAYGMFVITYVGDESEVTFQPEIRRETMPIRCVMDEVVQENASVGGTEAGAEKVENAAVMDSIVDSRDGQTYRTTKIGDQVWMAENLNYKTAGSFCYHDSTQYCEKLGRFYTWGSAMDSIGAFSANSKGCGSGTSCFPTYPVRGVCPAGFHLPTLEEWKTLVATAGGGYAAASKLVSAKRLGTGFNWVDEGSDDYGFSAYPSCNMMYDGRSGFCNPPVNYWSSIESSIGGVYHMNLRNSSDYNGRGVGFSSIEKYFAFTIRCVKDY